MKQKCVSRTAHVFTAVNRVVVGSKCSVSDICPHDQCLVVSPHRLKLKTAGLRNVVLRAMCDEADSPRIS